MIARKITYTGTFTPETVAQMYDIARKIEITGEVTHVNDKVVELNLEGDPSMIKLIQHQIDRKVKSAITGKEITQLPFQYYQGIVLRA